MTDLADRKTALYRHYDRFGGPLYFGVAVNPDQRFLVHQVTAWWPKVDASRTRIDWYPDRRTALAAEAAAIAAERPRFNRTRIPSGKQAGYGRDRQSFRLDPEEWEAFRAACQEMGTDRAAYLRSVIDWVLRKPGAKAPKRPPHSSTTSD